MPNWVTGRLTISGENIENVIEKITTKTKYDENEPESINLDFNKIIPMPKDLEIVAGSLTDRAVELYLTSLNPEVDYYGYEKLSKEEFDELLNNVKKRHSFSKYESILTKEEIDKYIEMHANDSDLKDYDNSLLEYGKHAVENVKKYEHMDWYSWSIANWGTKWNACSTFYDEKRPNIITFDTAWSDVRDVIFEMSKMFPKNEFLYEWAEEQIGFYAGYVIFQDGNCKEMVDFDSYSKEAYELSFDLIGCKDWFKYNEATGTYQPIEDESEGEME